MSCWNKEELETMLYAVVNELDLSDAAIEEHGSMGTPPAELVRLVLAQKDRQILLLKRGFRQIGEYHLSTVLTSQSSGLAKLVENQQDIPPEFNQAVDKMLDDEIANR